MNWKKLTHVALAAATLSGIAATASAQGQSCPDDALARTNSLERQIEQRLLAAQQKAFLEKKDAEIETLKRRLWAWA